MANTGLHSPLETAPPSSQRLVLSIGAALSGASLILALFVLPAEYGIDPTGLGATLGLTAMHAPARTLHVKDVIGGNQTYREVKIPEAGKPTPLPNPAISQIKAVGPLTRTITVRLGAGQETEIKALLDEAQVILYTWNADGEVYTDFHGHEPNAGEEFVRYEEQQSGQAGRGSLVAPFSGEHGWYWVNISNAPVTITLTVSGFYREIINYGLLR